MTKNEYAEISNALADTHAKIVATLSDAIRKVQDIKMMSEDHTEEYGRNDGHMEMRAEAQREADANHNDGF